MGLIDKGPKMFSNKVGCLFTVLSVASFFAEMSSSMRLAESPKATRFQLWLIPRNEYCEGSAALENQTLLRKMNGRVETLVGSGDCRVKNEIRVVCAALEPRFSKTANDDPEGCKDID